MEAVLYAEICLICLIVAGLLLFWTGRMRSLSTADLWMRRMLAAFVLSFAANLLFTVFNRMLPALRAARLLSCAFKTAFFTALVLGVVCWCGLAETEIGSSGGRRFGQRAWMLLLPALGLAAPLVNLFTPWMFDFGPDLSYRRYGMFRAEMWYLFAASALFGLRLLRRARGESDPARRSHLRLTASFPLCLLLAAILSYAGEAVPVICVCIAVELLCMHMGNTWQQISLDKLTQVNNRQNLIGFMNHKLKNHAGELYLLMIDLDHFKTINDRYGHLEGDRALTRLAGALKAACGPLLPRPYIARYGGDEFIVVLEGSQETVDGLCAELRRRLEEGNAQAPYRITVSIGCGRWQPGMDHRALIAAADEELYKIKNSR